MYVYYSLSVGVGFLSLVVFFILQWLQIPAGNLIDWLIGIASFYWLLAIVTIPWNIHFEAKEVLIEADTSQEKNIPIDLQQIKYIKQVVKWSIFVAILLHFLSAVVLYLLSFWGISSVAYITSIAALLLTFLRPALRGYQYLASRLSRIKKQIKYPREDVIELRGRVKNTERQIQELQSKFNLKNPQSFFSINNQNLNQLQTQLVSLNNRVEELTELNQKEHQKILRHSENAISQLSEDSQFLGNVKEIIRLIKKA